MKSRRSEKKFDIYIANDPRCKWGERDTKEQKKVTGKDEDKLQGVRKSPVILTPHFFLAWLEISSSYLVC